MALEDDTVEAFEGTRDFVGEVLYIGMHGVVRECSDRGTHCTGWTPFLLMVTDN